MMNTSRRAFFKTFLSAGAALVVSGSGNTTKPAEAAVHEQIKGVCLFVPTLGKASDFVELMNTSAPGNWTVHPLEGTLTDRYFIAKSLYEEAKGRANTFVGAVDPGSFAVVQAAIFDSGGTFHYITYEERNRITFSAQL
ncbi:MAG: twin-arginine translocation pathway signal protein [Desulfuromonadaceae bacterium]|nr:twin-arginine translocation pathway signal protein [Desulfuromonadaceae bacterium]